MSSTLDVTSDAFDDGESIPKVHSCEGPGLSPPLNWSGAPEGTKSFVVLCEDPDAPGGTFHHWAAFDIPADRRSLEGGVVPEPETSGLRQGKNDFGKPGYGAPCPPPGHGTHHYHFQVWALDTAHLGVAPGADYQAVKSAAEDHVLAKGELTGVYERQ